jgi:hypothetical protein
MLSRDVNSQNIRYQCYLVCSECAYNLGSMFFEEKNSDHYIQLILPQLFKELTDKDKLLIFENKSSSVRQKIF